MQQAGVDTRVEILPLLSDLALTANLLAPSGEAATYGDVLNAELRATDVLAAVTGAVVSGRHDTVRLAEVLYMPEGLRLLKVGNPIPGFRVQVSDLVFATAELLGMRLLDLGVDLSLGGWGMPPWRSPFPSRARSWSGPFPATPRLWPAPRRSGWGSLA